jgi:cellulose synthase/poly-beta-1,6-N-acetylglucosamine synthase-like glycosyltransferase/peptidoglycan/xylan/chitin deacetylase (PgdA/CDA1 family)/spore germination protein YaaH
MTEQRPVFFDPSRKRWPRLRQLMIAVSALLTGLFALLILSILVNPALPSLNLPSVTSLPGSAHLSPPLRPPVVPLHRRGVRAARQQIERERLLHEAEWKRLALVPRPTDDPVVFAFFVNWDEASLASLKRNIDHFDVLVAEWLHMTKPDGSLVEDNPERQAEALEFVRLRRPSMRVMPLLNNAAEGSFRSAPLAGMLASRAARARVIRESLDYVRRIGGAGISIDFENVPAASQPNLQAFMSEVWAAFHQAGLLVSMNVPENDPAFDYRKYASKVDYLIVMAYDEHWSTGDPGPVSSMQFFMNVLQARLADVPPGKLVMAIGNYAYDWPGRGGRTFEEAMLTAKEAGATITVDPESLNPTYRYRADNGEEHEVWILDAITAFNQASVTRALNPKAALALWRLGSEDPGIWTFFGDARALDRAQIGELGTVQYGYGVDFEGAGEILSITDSPKQGRRTVIFDDARALITDEKFESLPTPYVVTRYGATKGAVALTFDDGPDEKYTAPILDVLRDLKAPATFFVTGLATQEYPDLVRRMYREGHQIGNHTFTHPNIANISRAQLRIELTATQRLFESILGRQSVLFRPPYSEDTEPETPSQVRPIETATAMGYLTVGMQIDPKDYKRPGVDAIVARTVEQAVAGRGSVVLLHDGGGDRRETIAALPRIITELRRNHLKLVTVGELLGRTSAQVMPPVMGRGYWQSVVDALAFNSVNLVQAVVSLLFLIAIVLGLGRLVFIGSVAALERLLRKRRPPPAYAGPIAVIVPAYNEDKVIVQTVRSLLRSVGVPGLKILVVDDGSTDQTVARVREEFSGEPHVAVFERSNGGKSAALNFGLTQTDAEIVVALDADTVFTSTTIASLVRHFSDPQVGAVAGNAKVGNRVNLLTKWQALEYITSQNLDRRAFDLLGCITVVPGSVGAWRRRLVTEAGGFSAATLAEDADLTMTILRTGYRVIYDDEAIAYTEAPETWRAFVRQRHRWMFGTFQAAWKHRDALLRWRYRGLGFVALPNVFLFQVVFPLISPVIDLMMVGSLVSAGLGYWMHPAEFTPDDLWQVAFYYAIFLAADVLAACLAFLLERRESPRLLWLLLWQRFVYRQVMYYIAIRSVLDSLRGGPVGWNKIERRASVTT